MSSILQAVRSQRSTSQEKIWPFWNCRGRTESPLQWGGVDKLHASTVAKKADEMKKVQLRNRKQEAEVEKLFKKVAMEQCI